MPRRTKVDRAPIIAMLEQTGSIGETAKRLGIHYNTANQIDRIRRGLCLHCGKRPPRQDFTKCEPCAKWERNRIATGRADARKINKCTECNEPLKKGSALFCKKHHRSALLRKRKHQITRTHGAVALEVWNKANEACQICGKAWPEQKVHLHHIDENKANGSAANLIVVCMDCHYLIHRLIDCRNRKGLITWFEQAYPDRPLR